MNNTFGIDIIPENDDRRLEILRRYRILDTPPESAFDNIAKLATKIFGVPISLVSLVDRDQVYFKANVGMGDVKGNPRGVSLCSLAVLSPDVTVFEDAKLEPCLLANPLVAGEFGLQFYAGAPLTTHDGFNIGTLCVVDQQTRTFTEKDREILQGLALIVMDEIELRLAAIEEHEKQLAVKQQLENMVMNTIIGMNIFKGRELVIELANQPMFEIWGKTPEQALGKPLLTVFPELANQPFPVLMKNIFDTKEAVEITEIEVQINTGSGKKDLYISAKYAPLFDADGNVDSLVATIIDITDMVTARKYLEESEVQQQALNEELTATVEELAVINEELTFTNEELSETYEYLTIANKALSESKSNLEKSEERLRLSTEAANVCTWYIDLKTQEFIPSPSLKTLFGYLPGEEMTNDSIAAQIAAQHQEYVFSELETALKYSGKYDVEYMITRLRSTETRWIRATGKLDDNSSKENIYFSGVIIDITEKKLDELRKNDFIAMVSHELKTPLTSLKGYVQLLTAKNKKSEDTFTAAALQKVDNQVQKMVSIIDGFLNISELEAGKIRLNKRSFQLDELLQEVTADVKMTSSIQNISITSIIPVAVYADMDKIGQVINNFLSNAIKYAGHNKQIEVFCRESEGQIVLGVKDNGEGIKPGDLGKLFDRFYRVENTQSKLISGFGIGLYICAEIIQRHDGKIWAESEIGEGSTFYFSLPINH